MPDRTGVQRGDDTTVPATESEVAHDAAPARGKRLRGLGGLPNWPLRAKLVAVFVVPTVAALFLAGLRIADGFSDTAVYERATQRIDLAKHVSGLIDELQSERTAMSAWIVSGRPADQRDVETAINGTDHAAKDLRDARGLVDDIDDPATTKSYRQALSRLDSLDELRSAGRSSDFPASAVIVSYGVVVDALLDVSDQFGADVTDKQLQERHESLSMLAHAKEYSAQQNVYLLNAALRGNFKSAERDAIVSAQSNLVSAIDSFNDSATPEHRRLYQDRVSGYAVSNRFQLQELALERDNEGRSVGVSADDVRTSSENTLQYVHQVQTNMLSGTEGYTSDLLSGVRQELIITSIVLVVLLAAALALMLVVVRSLLRPLRTLRSSALEVADEQLPAAVEQIMHEADPRQAAEQAIAPVPVHTEEEVGQVARAFDVVHGQAVRLAAEQALLRENVNGIFVNLSRRSQRLVERQLGVIDGLESEEQDPDQLASLFELDHLATRLRRNGESLLVLSGAGLAKSMSRPVPAPDVLGAAVSEIEQYSRVEMGSIPQIAVQGSCVHDLVHLLAELFDNATYFSEPDTKISVRAVVTRRKTLAVQITDRGVGMSENQIVEANERLADPPDLDVSVTRRMGLYVVARLAQRHGIEVRLRENEDIEGGIIARIVVPQPLLVDVSEADSSLTPVPENNTGARPLGGDGAQAADAVTALSAASAAVYPELEPSNATALRQQTAWPTDDGIGENGATFQADVSSADSGEPAGLTPLDQPISLDELVGGTSAAGPFVTPGDEPAEPTPPQPPPVSQPDEPIWPGVADNADETSDEEVEQERPVVPRARPQYVPGAGTHPESEQPGDADGTAEGAALDDEVPTRRLPIYQSVLSRWFSEETPDDAESALPPDPPEEDLVGAAEPPQEPPVAQEWSSVSDAGWNAAESLWHTGDEETTSAGLPKRVPNAYLVPGSASSNQQSASPGFADTTSARPSQGAIARSADAARTRMVNFQRGYTKGRHALADSGDDSAANADGSGEPLSDDGMRQ